MNGVAVVHRVSCTAIEPRHGRGGTAQHRTGQLQPLLSGISDTQASVNPDVSPGGGVGMPSEETSARSPQENKIEQSKTYS
jgi:hypothetical protein